MKKFNQYKILLIFISLFIFGLFIRYFFGEDSLFWDIWSNIDVSFAVALGVLAFLAYKEMIKEEDEIELVFNVDGDLRSSGIKLLRKDCTRGEIVGVLGMMQKDTGKRFKITPSKLKHLLNEINKVQKENKNTIIIDMTQDEFEQFAIFNI